MARYMDTRNLRRAPPLPDSLKPLEELALDLTWDWRSARAEVFARLDPEAWRASSRNPVMTLAKMDPTRRETAASDPEVAEAMRAALEARDADAKRLRWFAKAHPELADATIAYFCAEFGLTESMPIYSGGLGVLAGDHLKSASDLGVPLVAVGLLYRNGYFRQKLDAAGKQTAFHEATDFDLLPITLERDAEGAPIIVGVELPGRLLVAQVWRVNLGCVSLYLLDTDVESNSEADRAITDALYQGGQERRVQQLMLLGIGGYRALRAVGHTPTVCHLNEGHAGFVAIERVRGLMQDEGLAFEDARERVASTTVFTTHTPVPAGFDRFTKPLLKKHLGGYLDAARIELDDFWALGVERGEAEAPKFNMAVLAIQHAEAINGVSKLHGEVSQALLQEIGGWSDLAVEDVPIAGLTNGIHLPTWLGASMRDLFDAHLPSSWRDGPPDRAAFAQASSIPDAALQAAHATQKRTLIEFVRDRVRWQRQRRSTAASPVAVADILSEDALTIGFARRFATYKRATLLFTDLERLRRIVDTPNRPVQFIFAGKAHPADTPGQVFIEKVVKCIRAAELEHRIVFLEDYDIEVGRTLVQGVDVWLNNPKRPHEASGTSGMKVVGNGGLNLSVLDGWWAEGYAPGRGWAIGDGEDWTPDADARDAEALYQILENEVVPTFYDHPGRWCEMVRRSIAELVVAFSSDRMVAEYVDRFYAPAARGR